MMSLANQRKAIIDLLDEIRPENAAAVYYALQFPSQKVSITTTPKEAAHADGYICSAMTGIDLFRPLITMRLPAVGLTHEIDYEKSLDLIYDALLPGGSYIISAPSSYFPLLAAVSDIHREERVKILVLKPTLFTPIINVLVMEGSDHNGLPRFIIRKGDDSGDVFSGDVMASAGLNWQSDRFAEIYVRTNKKLRRKGMGRSVVSRLIRSVLESDRIPLYAVSADNIPSRELAQSVGFVDTGHEEILLEVSLNPRPLS